MEKLNVTELTPYSEVNDIVWTNEENFIFKVVEKETSYDAYEYPVVHIKLKSVLTDTMWTLVLNV